MYPLPCWNPSPQGRYSSGGGWPTWEKLLEDWWASSPERLRLWLLSGSCAFHKFDCRLGRIRRASSRIVTLLPKSACEHLDTQNWWYGGEWLYICGQERSDSRKWVLFYPVTVFQLIFRCQVQPQDGTNTENKSSQVRISCFPSQFPLSGIPTN